MPQLAMELVPWVPPLRLPLRKNRVVVVSVSGPLIHVQKHVKAKWKKCDVIPLTVDEVHSICSANGERSPNVKLLAIGDEILLIKMVGNSPASIRIPNSAFMAFIAMLEYQSHFLYDVPMTDE